MAWAEILELSAQNGPLERLSRRSIAPSRIACRPAKVWGLLERPRRPAASASAAVRCPVAAIAGTAKRSWIRLAAARPSLPFARRTSTRARSGRSRATSVLSRACQAHDRVAERSRLAAEMVRGEPAVLGDGDAKLLHRMPRAGPCGPAWPPLSKDQSPINGSRKSAWGRERKCLSWLPAEPVRASPGSSGRAYGCDVRGNPRIPGRRLAGGDRRSLRTTRS